MWFLVWDSSFAESLLSFHQSSFHFRLQNIVTIKLLTDIVTKGFSCLLSVCQHFVWCALICPLDFFLGQWVDTLGIDFSHLCHIGYLRGLWELQCLMLFVAEFSLPSMFWKRMLKLFLDTLTWVICQINRQCFLYSKQIVRIHYLFSCVDFCLTPFHSFLQRPPRQTHLVSWPKKAKKSSARRWAWDSPGLFYQIVIAVALVCPTRLTFQFLLLISSDVTVYCAMP